MTKCSIVQDLLPLYVDGIASEDSRGLVDEHIAACPSCKQTLITMKSGIKLNVSDTKAIKTFKKFKNRLLRRNIIVAITSAALVIAIMIGFWSFVLTPVTPIRYEDGLLRAEIGTVKYVENADRGIVIITDATSGDYLESEVVDIISSRKTAQRTAASTFIEENGKTIELVFINFTENLLSKWEKGGETEFAFRVVEPQMEYYYLEGGQKVYNEPVDRIEIYYIDEILSKINVSKDYAALREKGNLVWSGSLQ